MAKAYRYKVIKSGKVCAEATTRAEAEREAARCGGTVRGPRQQNPALPIFVEERDGRGDVIISYPLTEDHTTAPTAASAMNRAQAMLRDRVPARSFSHVYEGRSKAAGQGYGWIVVIGPEYAAELAAPPPARSLAASFARRKRNPSRQFHAEVAAKDLAHARRLLEGLHRADVDLKPSARQTAAVSALVMAAKAYREFSYAGGGRKGYGPQIQEAGELYNQAEQALRGLVPNPQKVELTVPTAAEAGQFVGKYGAKAFRGLVTAGRGLASFVRSARAGAQAERGATANPRKRVKRTPAARWAIANGYTDIEEDTSEEMRAFQEAGGAPAPGIAAFRDYSRDNYAAILLYPSGEQVGEARGQGDTMLKALQDLPIATLRRRFFASNPHGKKGRHNPSKQGSGAAASKPYKVFAFFPSGRGHWELSARPVHSAASESAAGAWMDRNYPDWFDRNSAHDWKSCGFVLATTKAQAQEELDKIVGKG